jgi:hypothetical protein
MTRQPSRRVLIRYIDPAFTRRSPSWQLAQRVAEQLAAAGGAPARVRLIRVQSLSTGPATPRPDAVEVVVLRAPDRE